MQTVALKIFVEDPYQEFLIAELSDLDFEGFEQGEDYLIAYIPSARWDDVKREHIQMWMVAHGQSIALTEEVIQEENWNREWEETVAAVAIEPFLVKPTWREIPAEYQDLILLEIDPKMSFGTGYHESTRLILRLLPDVVGSGSRVLDAGTGTGILAIASAKVGAAHVDAFDIDPWSHRNALENVYLNQVDGRVHVHEGGIEIVPHAEYDVVLANINLLVIAGLINDFAERLSSAGRLLTSGILTKDRDRLLEIVRNAGFLLDREVQEGEWWCGVFVREPV